MPNHNPEAQASGERRRRALFGVPCAVIFREGERRQSELRDNNAAWVAGPSRICFPSTPANIHTFPTAIPSIFYSPCAFQRS